jgi:hypothetical protein
MITMFPLISSSCRLRKRAMAIAINSAPAILFGNRITTNLGARRRIPVCVAEMHVTGDNRRSQALAPS